MVSFEEFVEKGKHQINVGYVKGDSIAPQMYRFLLEKKLDALERKGVIANYEIAEGYQLERLDTARKSQGVTLCCIISDSLSPSELDNLCKNYYFSQRKSLHSPDRDFFTDKFRNDTRNHILKTPPLLQNQKGTLYHRYRYQHEDFVLVFTHARMMEAHISAMYHYNHHTIDL